MSARKSHVFYFRSEQIAEAAERRAAELEADLPDLAAEAARLRVELDNAIADSIDGVLAGNSRAVEKHEGFAVDQGAGWLDPGSGGTETVGLFVRVDFWWRYNLADRNYRQAKVVVERYLEDSARYRSQRDVNFELDEEDVRYFGLDR